MNAPQKTIMNANLFSRLFDGLDDPTRLAIETTDGQHISYGDLISRAGQMANVLVSRGVKPGDRVAAQTEKSVPGLVLYLATVRAGAVYLPLNTAYTLNELEYFIGDAEPSLVVCDPARAEGIGAIAAKVGAKVETLGADGKGSLTEAAAKAPAKFETVARADDDLAAILYTSGTTGRSKGAMLTHDNLASNSLTLVDYWRFTNKDVLIHALPIYHTHGLFVASNVTLFARASMIFLPKFDPETGKVLAAETIGMIEVKGPNVFRGYWRMPEKTKSEFRDDGFFITGDLGKIDDKGYVHILGRGKDLVISGGFNVYPKEIESEIDAMPGVIESAVIGVPHADFGEGVTAVVVCNKGAGVSEASVLGALDGRLAKFKMPKRVFIVDDLPRNAMGKVQKNILRDTYKGIYTRR